VLTEISIRGLPKLDGRKEYADGKVDGLWLVVQSSGKKSWAVRYRHDGVKKKFTVGSYPAVTIAAARQKALAVLAEVAGGRDPAGVKQADLKARREARALEASFKAVVETFLDDHVKGGHVGAAWGVEMERLLRHDAIPVLGDKPLVDVTRSDVRDLVKGIANAGRRTTANRNLAVLRKFFNWAVENERLSASPCVGLKAPAPENERDRVLSDAEIAAIWRAFESVGWPFGPLGKLLLLTGARRDELAESTWADVDPDAACWSVARERSKNKVAHEIPLSDSALAIVKSLPKIGDKPKFVFSTTGKTSVSGFANAKNAIDGAILKAAKKEAQARGANLDEIKPLPRWTLHDLRRTCASGMAALGVPPHVVEAVLNHKSGTIKGVAAIYNRYQYQAEKRDALDKWAGHLKAIVG
jgi:integrase